MVSRAVSRLNDRICNYRGPSGAELLCVDYTEFVCRLWLTMRLVLFTVIC